MSALRRGAIAAIAAATALVVASPAAAYDAGPHAEVTRDAMTAEGFGDDATGVAEVNNWFVDLYRQAQTTPFSGHAGFWKRLLAGAIQTEGWSDELVGAAYRSHFAITPTFSSTDALAAEWTRLQRAVWTLVREARDQNDPAKLLAVLGMSLHQLQDFYTHANWVEPKGRPGADGPGWRERGFGSSPTWFDVPAGVRDEAEIYASDSDGRRAHGYWNTDGNHNLTSGLNKDWPGRPFYAPSITTAYFATRQWIQAVRLWVDDEAFWSRAQHYRANADALRHDLTGMFEISIYSGHWQGQGEPFGAKAQGPGGNLLDLRQAVKSYFQANLGHLPPASEFGLLRGRTEYRARFEGLVQRMADPNPSGEVGPVPSSQDLQRQTRFVVLRILSLRGEGLGDPGPDDADMYARVQIDGQPMASAVIHGHDSFFFPDPSEPFTWFKAVPATASRGEPVRSVEVEVKTAHDRWAGTDDDVFLRLGRDLRFPLDKRLHNDFERGDRDTYSVPTDDATQLGMKVGDITQVTIEKGGDGIGGGWKLGGVKLRVNGELAYESGSIGRWLEDGHRTWVAPDFERRAPRGMKVPIRIRLREDDTLYGGDDDGDINPDDRRDTVSFGYTPGPRLEGRAEGGNRLGGRLGYGGDRAAITYSVETITPELMKSVKPPEAPREMPDLMISAFGHFEITVRNQGAGDAGPFRLLVEDRGGGEKVLTFPGLRAGASAARRLDFLCSGPGPAFAVVDDTNEVAETDEANNTSSDPELVIC